MDQRTDWWVWVGTVQSLPCIFSPQKPSHKPSNAAPRTPALPFHTTLHLSQRFSLVPILSHRHFLPHFKNLHFASDFSVNIMNVSNEVLDQVCKIKSREPTRQNCEWTWQGIKSSRVPTLPIFKEGRQNTNLCVPFSSSLNIILLHIHERCMVSP